ncbi:SGNH/GDSL hydrolase family protein [Arthrobacter agilis]|uniref:SGNH/GDSL hydrolase family protein n=1 Tax=Arthrobacter agilis TaxID=37921 RepID=UPI00278AB622|nr:SGNH/GDSL hydrolase family protein [Arthrobacter agilis]MDQ0734059.1 acyl-CoA thioesterase-1 [Arthrobacter agilis]
MSSVRKKKRRPSISRRLKAVALACGVVAVAFVFGALHLVQQERVAQAVAEASSYTPKPIPSLEQTTNPEPVVAFIGDSYSAGAGASSGANNWTYLLSRELGWKEVNLARGGTGYLVAGMNGRAACGLDYCPSYPEMIDEVAAAKPTMVLVAGGRNDLRVESPDQVHTSVRDFYSSLRAALPNVTIYAVNPLWDDDVAPAAISDLTEVVRDSVESVGGTFLDIGQPLQGAPELVSDDSVHPSDVGHRTIFEALAAKLKAAA